MTKQRGGNHDSPPSVPHAVGCLAHTPLPRRRCLTLFPCTLCYVVCQGHEAGSDPGHGGERQRQDIGEAHTQRAAEYVTWREGGGERAQKTARCTSCLNTHRQTSGEAAGVIVVSSSFVGGAVQTWLQTKERGQSSFLPLAVCVRERRTQRRDWKPSTNNRAPNLGFLWNLAKRTMICKPLCWHGMGPGVCILS